MEVPAPFRGNTVIGFLNLSAITVHVNESDRLTACGTTVLYILLGCRHFDVAGTKGIPVLTMSECSRPKSFHAKSASAGRY